MYFTLESALKLRPDFLCLVALAFFISGCVQPPGDEIMESDLASFRNGEDYLRQGRHDQALSSFLKVVETTPIAPESHLNLGSLYLRRARDPILAIYHFKQYLKFKPASRQAPMVKELINTAKKEFARTFPANLFDAELERIDMLDVIEKKDSEILALKKELARLKAESNTLSIRLKEAQARAPSFSSSDAPVVIQQRRVQPMPRSNLLGTNQTVNPPASELQKIYTVEPGDTVIVISRRVYGTPDRYKEIYEANKDIMPDMNTLQVGWKLRIPD